MCFGLKWLALYAFKGDGKNELSLEVGDRLKIEEETKGWFKGCSLVNPTKRGIFPANYVKTGDSLDALQKTPDVTIMAAQYTAKEWVEEINQLAQVRNEQKLRD